MKQENGIWVVEATVKAAALLEDFYGVEHTAANDPTVTLEYVNNKWAIRTDEDTAVIVAEGQCETQPPAAPVLGENLDMWMQLYTSDGKVVVDSQLGSYAETYGESIRVEKEPYEENGEWKAQLRVYGYSDGGSNAPEPEHCYVNVRLKDGYSGYEFVTVSQSPYKTIVVTWDRNSGKWICPLIPDNQGGNGEKRGVAFMVKEKGTELEAPALPPENPVYNGFWVSLYTTEADPKTGETVYTEVATVRDPWGEDYITVDAESLRKDPLFGYQVDVTVNPEKALEALNPGGEYQLVTSMTPAVNKLMYDFSSNAWIAMVWGNGWEVPSDFKVPGTNDSKTGVAFCVERKADAVPALPPTNPVHTGFWVSLYTYEEDTKTYTEVGTIEYDGAQNFVDMTYPVSGGILGTYTTTVTVSGEKALEGMGLSDKYQLYQDKDHPTLYPASKENTMMFDWVSMTWSAQTMNPQEFKVPGTNTIKRGLAFRVEEIPEEPAPELPQVGKTTLRMQNDKKVTITYQCDNQNSVHKAGSPVTATLNLISGIYVKGVTPAQKNEAGQWTSMVTLDAAAMLASKFDKVSHTADDVTVPVIYNEQKERWEIADGTTLTLIGNCAQNGPEAPDRDNCKFMVTVYGWQPKDNGPANTQTLSSMQWYLFDDEVEFDFGDTKKNADGTWTCDVTVSAEDFVASVFEEFESSHYRRDLEEPTEKTITLTYDQRAGKWRAPSDGVKSDGVGFRLIQQYELVFAPGHDIDHKVPAGDKYSGGVYDIGADVRLPDSANFVPTKGVFAGWKVTIKETPSQSKIYFYPLGTEMVMTMFGRDVEAEAYWMDVKLEAATIPYDKDKQTGDYTFSDKAEIEVPTDADAVTVLYRATVMGNSEYPYELIVDGATPAYGSDLSGKIEKLKTTKYVYFTKTYAPMQTTELSEMAKMGNAESSAQVTLKVPTNTITFAANGGAGTMDPVAVRTGADYTLPECGFTAPEGKEFDCWNVNGENMAPGAKVTVTEDMEIVALWKATPATGEGSADGGSDSDSSGSQNNTATNNTAPNNTAANTTNNTTVNVATGTKETPAVTAAVPVPTTGDSAKPVLWATLAGASAMAAAALTLIRRKRANQGRD